jgi:hypothetical protein
VSLSFKTMLTYYQITLFFTSAERPFNRVDAIDNENNDNDEDDAAVQLDASYAPNALDIVRPRWWLRRNGQYDVNPFVRRRHQFPAWWAEQRNEE